MAGKYQTAASADKEYDIEWYAVQVQAVITALQNAVPAWTQDEIKGQLLGRLTNLIPSNN
jgi:hypothetical protein